MSKSATLDDLLFGKTPSSNGDAKRGNYLADLIASCHDCARAAQALPHGAAYDYFKAYPEFDNIVDGMKGNLWDVMSRLGSSISRTRNADAFSTVTQDVERFQALVETVDDALEEVTTRLHRIEHGADDLSLSAPAVSGNAEPLVHHNDAGLKRASLQKPQLNFKTPVDNSMNPYRPRIREKPNAMVPLDEVTINGLPDGSKTSYPHPYRHELENFAYPADQVTSTDIELYGPFDKTPLHWVDTVDAMLDMKAKLDASSAFAVDLEHHSYRTFQGITCLMQISTRTEDFLVDTIALRDDLHQLNSAFTDPAIVKVLHGANMDVLWLQRDLGIYVVNMFDTGQASRLLELKSYSLANLLMHYCNIKADKKYQTADWRLRPLSVDMLKYAREDTHYLLYIYDRLRQELIDKSLILQQGNPSAAAVYGAEGKLKLSLAPGQPEPKYSFLVATCLNRSRDLCLSTYEKELDTRAAALALQTRHQREFSDASTHVFVRLYTWRDRLAREHDESTGYVLSNTMLFSLAKSLPRDEDALARITRPMSPFVKEHMAELLDIIASGRMGFSGPSMTDDLMSMGPGLGSPVFNRDQLYRVAGWDLGSIASNERIVETNAASADYVLASSEALAMRSTFDLAGLAMAKARVPAQTADIAFIPAERSEQPPCMLSSAQSSPVQPSRQAKIDEIRSTMVFSTPQAPARIVKKEPTETAPVSTPAPSKSSGAQELGEGIAAVEELNPMTWNQTSDNGVMSSPNLGQLAVLQSPSGLQDKGTAIRMSEVYKLSTLAKHKDEDASAVDLREREQMQRQKQRARDLAEKQEPPRKAPRTDEEMFEAVGWRGRIKDSAAGPSSAASSSAISAAASPFVYDEKNVFATADSNVLAQTANESKPGFYNPYSQLPGKGKDGKKAKK
jgi:ribonuclease D